MGWLSNLFSGGEQEELEGLIRQAPAPSLFARLIRLHLESGASAKALEAARRGTGLFPDSAELRDLRARAERSGVMAEAEQLRQKIERFPNPSLYARLANIYLELDDLDACTKACTLAVKTYPDYAGIYLVMAQVSRRQKRMDLVSHYLNKTVALDPCNYAAHMQRAEDLIAGNTPDEARKELEAVLAFAPEDERAQAMLAALDTTRSGASTASMPAVTQKDVAGSDTRKLEAIGRPGAAPSPEAGLATLAETSGVEAGLLIDASGRLIASQRNADSFDEELAAAVVSNVCRAVRESAPDLGIGDFLETLVEGEFGSVEVMPVNDLLLAAFATPDLRPARLQRAVHECARSMAAT